MATEITIMQRQIQQITQHGIHFINDFGEDDFLAFALSYECLIAATIETPVQDFGSNEQYEKFLHMMQDLQTAAVYDDQYGQYEIMFVQDAKAETIYIVRFDSGEDYLKLQDMLVSRDWDIYLTSKLY